MLEHNINPVLTNEKSSAGIISKTMMEHRNKDEKKKQFKKELLDIFHKFGYLGEGKDYEVKIRTTSGSIAWININSIETIK